MANRKYLNLGSFANDGTGDTLRDAADKIEYNFGVLYNSLTSGNISGSGTAPSGVGIILITSGSPITITVIDGTDVGETLTFINTQPTTITFNGTFLTGSNITINEQQALMLVWSGSAWAVVSGAQ